MTPPKIKVSQLTLYNPARMKDVEIVASFMTRKAVFERVIADIAAEKPDSRAQHHLVVGQRGMGKSTLLARVAAELRMNVDLSKRFVPLVFAEEQYAVDRMSKFWLNCLDSLADAAERLGDTAGGERIDVVVRDLKTQPGGTANQDEAPARTALNAFLKAAESSGKRPVLLVDNLQLVFERTAEIEQHSLRELLMRPGSPILVGASPSPPPESQDYGAAFYDHFKIHYLRPLSQDEMRELMLKLAEITDRTDVRDKVLAHPERLKTLRDLTGGNPRTAVTLFFLFAEDFSPSVFADLENLLDRVTPHYKARVEELAGQQQVVVSAVGYHWAPITAHALSEATGLPMASISAQLDRLEKSGVVEKVEIFGQTSTGYQIAERFFNVWFLMRSASRRQRREVEFLVRFIESFYEAEDRPRLAEHLMNERNLSPDRLQFAKALGCTLDPNDKEDLARHAELDALRQKATEARRKLKEVIDFSKLHPGTLAFDQLREKLMALPPTDAEVSAEEFAEQVLGDRGMFMRREREKLAKATEKISKESVGTILASIIDARNVDFALYGETAVDWFRKRLATGQLRSSADVQDWNRSFLNANGDDTLQIMLDSMPWFLGSQLSDDVRTRIRKSLTPKPQSPAVKWYEWGCNLHHKLRMYSDAEEAYRKAIEINPTEALAWHQLGGLLQVCLRAEEAESALRKAIELNPNAAYSWHNLGDLLQNHLHRFTEAEAAYRKAIEIDATYYCSWNNLGNLLRDHLARFDEAEEAYRQGIAIRSDDDFLWGNLAGLLQSHLGRFDDAAAAYGRAIEIEPRDANLRAALGDLLQDNLGRFAEAEVAYRKAIEINPANYHAWIKLANLFRDHLGRIDEAEGAYRKALDIFPQVISAEPPATAWPIDAWIELGDFYCDHCQKHQDGVLYLAKALEQDEYNPIARHYLVFLYRDYMADMESARHAFAPFQASRRAVDETDILLQEALFAAYDANWGICGEALAKAIEDIGQQFPYSTKAYWFHASAVLLHLNFGEHLLAFLRQRGDATKLRPWYEALSALQNGDRRYLQNIPVEVRKTAEHYFDQIEKRLNALPEKTRRRAIPKPAKKRRKTGGR